MKVAVHCFYEKLTTDGYLFKNKDTHNGQDTLKPWNDFYQQSASLGWELVTLDQISDPAELAACLFSERTRPDDARANAVLAQRGVFKILSVLECPMIKPDSWDLEYHRQFDRVFTWSDDLVDGKFYLKHNFANDLTLRNDFDQLLADHDNRKLACMINSCIVPPSAEQYPKNLYGHRIAAIRWFEANHPEDFELWGNFWNKDHFPSYRGRSENKYQTFGNYKFAICLENAYGYSGYISEKLLDCLISGIVPIYWGAPNISDWIPEDCYIDIRKFESYPQLYFHLQQIDKARYQQYLESIRDFLATSKGYPFASKTFFSTLVDLINFETTHPSAPKTATIHGKTMGVTRETHYVYQNKKSLDLTLLPKARADHESPLMPLDAWRGLATKNPSFDPRKLLVIAGYGDELPVFPRARGIWEFLKKLTPEVRLVFFRDSSDLPYGEIQPSEGDTHFGIGSPTKARIDNAFFGLDPLGYRTSGVWSAHENYRVAFRAVLIWRYLLEMDGSWQFLYSPTITSMVSLRSLMRLLAYFPSEGVYAGYPGTLRHAPYEGVGMIHGANTLLSRDIVEKLVDRAISGHTNAAQPSDHWIGLLLPDVSRIALPLFTFETAKKTRAEIEDCYDIANSMLAMGHFHFRVKTSSQENTADGYRREEVDPSIMFRVAEAILSHTPSAETLLDLARRMFLAAENRAPRDFILNDREFYMLRTQKH